MATIRLHDTRSGALTELAPRDPGKVGIYACGPTVYNRIHVGNARPFVVFSLLKRFLEHEGYEVTFVANVTDADALELGRPDHEPKAAETIDAMIAYIQTLIDRGHAYAVAGDVYFRVR